jgi:hypothetical protein
MKTLVIGDQNQSGVYLAEHLGCTLYNGCDAGDGIVTKVDEVQDVWNKVLFMGEGHTISSAIGYTPIGHDLQNNLGYFSTIMEGQGLLMANDKTTGIEVGVMGWHDKGWIGQPLLMVEQMGFMNRDLGVKTTNPQGVTAVPINSESLLNQQVVKGCDGLLNDYVGPVCFRFIVNGAGVHAKSARFGFQNGWMETALELQKGGLLSDPFNFQNSVAVGVLVTVPNYPYTGAKIVTLDIDVKARKHLRFNDIKLTDKKLTTAGQSGKVFMATSWGETGEELGKEARMRIYRSLRNMDIPNMQYRTDVSSTAKDVTKGLSEIGVL